MEQSGNRKAYKAYMRCAACLLTGILFTIAVAFSVRMKASADAKEEQEQLPLYPYVEGSVYVLPVNTDILLEQEDGTQEKVLLGVSYTRSAYNGYSYTTTNLVCETAEASLDIPSDGGGLKAVYGICTSGKILMAAVFEKNTGKNNTSFFYIDKSPYSILLTDGAYRPDTVSAEGEILLHEKLLFGLEKRNTCYLKTDSEPWEVEQIATEDIFSENRIYFLLRPLRYIPDDNVSEDGFLADFSDRCQVIDAGGSFVVLSYREEDGRDWYQISYNGGKGWICVENERLKLQNSRLTDVFTSVAGIGNVCDNPHYDLNQTYRMSYQMITQEADDVTCSDPVYIFWAFGEEVGLIMAECNGRLLTLSFVGSYWEFEMPTFADDESYSETSPPGNAENDLASGSVQMELPEGAKDVLLVSLDLDRSDARAEVAVQYTVDTEDGEQTYSRFFTGFANVLFPISIWNGEKCLDELPICFYRKQEQIVLADYEGEFAYVYNYYPVYEPEEQGGLRVMINGEEKRFGLTAEGNQITDDFRKDYDYGTTGGLIPTLAAGD